MQMFFVVVLAILTVISWYGFIRCMVNPNWLRQKGDCLLYTSDAADE